MSALVEFLQDRVDLSLQLKASVCLPDLAFLTDLTSKLDNFKTELQGGNKTVIKTTDTVDSFNGKLKLWKTSLMKGVVTNFPNVQRSAGGT